MAKFRDEGAIHRARVTAQQRELDDLHAKFLLQQQLSFEAQLKEREERELYEEQIAEFKDKLDRKEFFMQNKERKWLEIEKVLEEYVHEDDELRDKLLELRLNVAASGTKKISNVVQENDKLKVQLDNAHEEISKLRKRLLNVDTQEQNLDPLNHKEEYKNEIEEQEEEEEGDEEEEYDEEEDEEG